MSEIITNATPLVVNYGIQDLSARTVTRESTPVPQHLPKIFFFAQKGPTNEQLAVGNDRYQIYGEKSFLKLGGYHQHTTALSNRLDARGNACMYVRVLPDDVGPYANLIAYLDVLETTVDRYKRNSDGSYALDALGRLQVEGQTAGYKCKWVVEHYTDAAAFQNYGKETIKNGDQVEGTKQSKRYPIFGMRAYSQGSYGNMCGIRFFGLTNRIAGLPTEMMSTQKAFPYRFQFITREDELSTPSNFKTVFGEPHVTVTLKKNTVDPALADKRMYIGETLLDSYRNLTDARYDIEYGLFDDLLVFQDNIDLLVSKFHAAEVPFIRSTTDFTADPASMHLFNIATGVDSSAVPYESFVFVDDANSTKFSEYTPVMAKGGSDGTMSLAMLDKKVIEYMARYADPDDELQDLALHPESTVIDSGFGLEAKKSLAKIIAIRKDTYVTLGTHVVGGQTRTASEEYSVGNALRTHLQLYPESDYFATKTARGRVIMGSGVLNEGDYDGRLPCTFAGAMKDADLAGAANGSWKIDKLYMGQPGSYITEMRDFNLRHVPNSVRKRYWEAGLTFFLPDDRETFFCPAWRTVYGDDTSVLTAWPTVMACAKLNKVTQAVWRELSGVIGLSDLQFIERANNGVRNRVRGIFGGLYVIVPRAAIREMDVLRGYSWTLPVDIGADVMKTAMTTYVRALRRADVQE